MQLDAYLAKRDARITEGETSNASFDHVLPEAEDEGVSLIGVKCFAIGRQGALELG